MKLGAQNLEGTQFQNYGTIYAWQRITASGVDQLVAAGRRTKIIRSLRSGQITIPAEFRREMGIESDSLLRVTLEGGELRIAPVRESQHGPGSGWLRDLYDQFAVVREEARAFSDEEINAAIDDAVKAVRAQHA